MTTLDTLKLATSALTASSNYIDVLGGTSKHCRQLVSAIEAQIKELEADDDSDIEHPCSDHPDAPHGFDRNGSHNAGRYVCVCEGWVEPKRKGKRKPDLTVHNKVLDAQFALLGKGEK